MYPYIIAQEKALENNYIPVLDDDGYDDSDYDDFDGTEDTSSVKYVGKRTKKDKDLPAC